MKRTEIYYPDGLVLVRMWEHGTRPAYRWLSRVVDGLIESVDFFMEGDVQALANEEGRLRGMEGNVPGMKAINWPEPPGGWASFDANNLPDPEPAILIGFGDSPADIAAALAAAQRRWSPVVGPILVMRGWGEDSYETDEKVNPPDLGKPHSVTPDGVLVPLALSLK